jgi:hypothetical protein
MTPHALQYGHAQALQDARRATLEVAFLANTMRFKGRRPQPHVLPAAAWINPPPKEPTTFKELQPCTVNL